MKQDVKRRVEKIPLPKSKGMQAIFEAVQNGLDAQDHELSVPPVINIRFRVRDELVEFENPPVEWIEIRDNGVGLDPPNFDSFWTADSGHKAPKGGQGCGRFLWLKVFDHAAVESVYRDEDTLMSRSFVFSLLAGTKEECPPAETTIDRDLGTVVRLNGPQEHYAASIPRTAQSIAESIALHFAYQFTESYSPEIHIVCDNDGTSADVKDELERLSSDMGEHEFEINGASFTARHQRRYQSQNHYAYLCAHGRVVELFELKDVLQFVPTDADGNKYAIHVYFSADVLDQNVDSATRSRFNYPGKGELDLGGLPDYATLVSGIKDHVSGIHMALIGAHNEKHTAEVRTLVSNEPRLNPYLVLINRRPDVALKVNLSNDVAHIRRVLSAEEVNFIHDQEQVVEKSFSALTDDVEPPSEEAYTTFKESHEAINETRLAHYLFHRRWALKKARGLIRRNSEGEYELEKELHNFILPRGTTTAETPSSSHNLWLVDERLAFKALVASDKSFRAKGIPTETDSRKEPDLIGFETALLSRDGSNSGGIHIVEFKRPGTRASGDPIQQVLEYVAAIRAGKVRTFSGEAVDVGDSIPMQAHIIANIDQHLKGLLQNADFKKRADGDSYFKFHETRNVFIEVFSFERMLRDAECRHQMFFEKLGLGAI